MLSIKATGTCRVFRNMREKNGETFATYNATIGRKVGEGEYENASIDIKFIRTKQPMEWMTAEVGYTYRDIEIVDGFVTFRQYESGGKKMTRYYIQVMDWK